MFDIGWSEMFIIAVLAIVVIGPKQLPQALRTVGYWVGKVRGMARDFQNQIDDVVRESELDEIKQNVESISNIDVNDQFNDAYDPSGTMDEAFQQTDEGDQIDAETDTAASEIVFDPPEFNAITEPVEEQTSSDASDAEKPAKAISETA